jgi:serine/threonine-protein kinase
MLTGAPAFEGETLGDVFVKICHEPLIPLRDKRPELPEALCEVVAKSLARDKEERYPDARVQRSALVSVLATLAAPRDSAAALGARVAAAVTNVASPSGATSAPNIPNAKDEVKRPGTRTQAAWGDAAQHRRRRSAWGIVAAITVGVGVAVGVSLWPRADGAHRPATAGPSAGARAEPPPVGSPQATAIVTPAESPSASAARGTSAATASASAPASSARAASSRPPSDRRPAKAPASTKKTDDLGI